MPVMKTPFTVEQFFDIFRIYNEAVWPFQIFLNALAILSIVFCIFRLKFSTRLIYFILGFLWLWMGGVYHLMFFSKINPAAFVFGSLFIVQSGLFIILGVTGRAIAADWRLDGFSLTGILFILYGLLIYPLIVSIAWHGYPFSPTFGLPCPTTIYTFGVLLLMNHRIRIWTILIPFLWSIVGFFAALNFRVFEDIGLLIAGIAGIILLTVRNRKYIGN